MSVEVLVGSSRVYLIILLVFVLGCSGWCLRREPFSYLAILGVQWLWLSRRGRCRDLFFICLFFVSADRGELVPLPFRRSGVVVVFFLLVFSAGVTAG